MPKRRLSLIQWSKSAHAYELSGSESSALGEIISERSAWFAWLQDISSFAFQSQSGVHYTVRKEHVQRNGPYWYGYRSFHGRTVKRYVGRTADLSLARLEEVAERFTDTTPSHIDPSTLPSSPLPSAPLLVSRFRPPRLPPVLVERKCLFAQLDAWRSRKLTLLWAPAGFGKTTLVNSWQSKQKDRRNGSHIAWVSLEAKDNDPTHFWRSLISTCQTWQPGIGETALVHLQRVSVLEPPLASVPLELPLTLFLNDLAHQVSEGILILDDYHSIVEPRVHETLVFFIEHLPVHIHVMILTRDEPALPLVHWRAHGDIQELSSTDLRFSQEETTHFLQETTASAFSEQTITQLDTLLEGWAAGLRLLVLAGQLTREGVERHLSTLNEGQPSGTFRGQLLDYFVSEVLVSQPEALQLFLLQTSGLPRLTGPLCDVVTDRHNSAALLETLERAGLFLEALDEAELCYRYHSLWASALRIEASQRLGEEALHAISRHASRWYEQHELAREAIETALYVHDVERAGVLIESFGASGQRYELQTLRGWLEQIPDMVVHAHPALCLYAALTFQFQEAGPTPPGAVKGRIEELLQRAEEGWQSLGKLTWVGLSFAFRALIASLQRSYSQEAVEHATNALRLLEARSSDDVDDLRATILEWRIICLGIIESAALHQGRFEEAKQLLQEALTCSQESSNRQFLGEINVRLGEVSMALGKLLQASEYYRQALSLGQSQENNEECVRALLGLAQLSFEWNDLKTSEQQASEVLELTQKVEKAGSEQAAYLLALLCSAREQNAAALLQLAALLARLQATPTQDTRELFSEALALQARLHLATGDYLAAQRSFTLLEDSAEERSFAQQMMVNILQARLQMAQGKVNEAVFLLEQLYQVAQEKQHLRSQLEIQMLLALAQASRKQKNEARKWLQQALSQAHNEGFLRIFLTEGEPLAHLLRSLLPGIREKALRSYGQTILRALTRRPEEALFLSPSSVFGRPPLERLSPQEKRVLRLLVAGWSNPEIARELVISVNTVKDHVKHLYGKLGVSNRLEAYEAARRLDLF
ncbi:helix-turn-helix transcriptional regulator [Reticulibacter mediterranei]|uniref:Helix-turn-helix transcriptional regulator n=1 Tax=Reticulibacter mediterranei TaxID=2778369 RepID=A0A8J3N0I2_9CHLR|nr:LuxR C-terminal-related transcriptional regulator [Reticulibacter mediterranei]GHO90302.1 helix-turn-helix transcriptional regulator [Reticulibacter mediterranei]